jgi:acylphosphatase
MTRISRKVIVNGLVQGVFFRKYTTEKATALQLDGLVRNEPDGSVYIEVEGEEDSVREFLSWCHKGSPSSHVEKVMISEMTPSGQKGFHIRY